MWIRMLTYVVLSDHFPKSCPPSNNMIRQFAVKKMGEMDQVTRNKVKVNVSISIPATK